MHLLEFYPRGLMKFSWNGATNRYGVADYLNTKFRFLFRGDIRWIKFAMLYITNIRSCITNSIFLKT